MPTLTDLRARRDALSAQRSSGIARVSYDGKTVEYRSMPETLRGPAEDVLHIYRPLDAGQIRGLPHVAPAMVRLFLLDQYDDAELDRKKTAAMFAGFITKTARMRWTPNAPLVWGCTTAPAPERPRARGPHPPHGRTPGPAHSRSNIMKSWYTIRARDSGAEVLIYDEIGAYAARAQDALPGSIVANWVEGRM